VKQRLRAFWVTVVGVFLWAQFWPFPVSPLFAQQWSASRSGLLQVPSQQPASRFAAAGYSPRYRQQSAGPQQSTPGPGSRLELLPHPEDFVAQPPRGGAPGIAAPAGQGPAQQEPHVQYFSDQAITGPGCDTPITPGYTRSGYSPMGAARPGWLVGGPIRDRLSQRPWLRSRFGNEPAPFRPILGGIRRGGLAGEGFMEDPQYVQTNRPIRDFIFPIFPLFRQRWPSSPGLQRPRSFWLNPFAIQQGLGNLIFRGSHPADTGALGFPYSMVPSHLVDRVPRPFFDLSRNQSQGRHIGRGIPFRDSSWSNRPVHISWFTGVLFTGDLNDQVSSSNGLYNGFRVGWDFDHYWGTEFRYGFASHSLQNRVGEVDIRTADISILYYPWGDSRWRPYTSLGVGFGTYDFLNANGNSVDEATFQLPLGIGLKYSVRPWWAARIEAVNLFSFESGDVDFMNNVLLSGSIEIHFGGRRRMYFPFDEGPSGF